MSVVEVKLDNRVRFFKSDLSDVAVKDLVAEFTHSNPIYHKLKKMNFNPGYRREARYIKTFRDDEHDGSFSVPRGGLNATRRVFRLHGLKWKISDERSDGFGRDGLPPVGGHGDDLIPPHQIKLWEHQERIVSVVLAKENCVVKSATGSGKTTAVLAAIAQIQLPTIVIVWSGALMKQWVDRIVSEMGIPRNEIGIIGGGSKKLAAITIAMQQTLNKLGSSDWSIFDKAFGVVCCDEVQRFAANTFFKSIDRFHSKYRIGVSADHTRRDGKEFLIKDIFGRVAVDVSQEELVGKGLVHDVAIRFIRSGYVKSTGWYNWMRASKRVPDFNKLLNEMTNDDMRNDLIIDLVVGLAGEGKKIVVFSHRVEHCKFLNEAIAAKGVSCGLMIGGKEWAEVFEATKSGLMNGTCDVAVGTYGGTGVGMDLPRVDCGVIATPVTSNKQFINQVAGRLSRTARDKVGAVLYVIWDDSVHGVGVVKRYRKLFKNVKIMK